MIDGKQVVALIPARSGSKGLPGKNMLPIEGRPLIAWTIYAAINSRIVDHVIVSSDSQDVLDVTADLGARPLVRPRHLATDSSLASEVIRHAIEGRENCDILAYLQPTSPLRTSVHIDEAIMLLTQMRAEAVVSVYETQMLPELMYRANASGRLEPVIARPELRRQDLPETYVVNGAIYVAITSALAHSGYHFSSMRPAPYVMLEKDSIDIDDLDDFEKTQRSMSERRPWPGDKSM